MQHHCSTLPTTLLLTALAVWLTPGSASAETDVSTQKKSQHTEYVRLEFGAGYPWVIISSQDKDGNHPTSHSTSAGLGPSTGVFIGSRNASGVSAGAALLSTFGRTPGYHDYFDGIYIFGGSVDYSISSIKNLGVGAVLGLSTGWGGIGLGASGSVRYDWPVRNGVSLGIVGRLTYTVISDWFNDSHDATRRSVDPGILFSVTCL